MANEGSRAFRETGTLKLASFPGIPRIPDLSFPGKREKWPKIVNFPGNGIPGIPGSKLYSGCIIVIYDGNNRGTRF